MFIGRVVGTVWATKKTESVVNLRWLIVHPYNLNKEPTRDIIVVADTIGAGVGEDVVCAFGRAARLAVGNENAAIEAAVIGIVDRIDIAEPWRRRLAEQAEIVSLSEAIATSHDNE